MPSRVPMSVIMHVIENIAFTATDVASKIFAFLKANYLKYQAMKRLLNHVVSKAFRISN